MSSRKRAQEANSPSWGAKSARRHLQFRRLAWLHYPKCRMCLPSAETSVHRTRWPRICISQRQVNLDCCFVTTTVQRRQLTSSHGPVSTACNCSAGQRLMRCTKILASRIERAICDMGNLRVRDHTTTSMEHPRVVEPWEGHLQRALHGAPMHEQRTMHNTGPMPGTRSRHMLKKTANIETRPVLQPLDATHITTANIVGQVCKESFFTKAASHIARNACSTRQSCIAQMLSACLWIFTNFRTC